MATSEPNGTQVAESLPSKLKLWWPLIALVIVVAALIVGERAFQRAKPQGWTTYTTADGLASNDIASIALAADNAVWIGTDGGVSRFDGAGWTTYTAGDGLACDRVASIAVAPAGAVWVEHQLDGVSSFDGEAWNAYTDADGLPDYRVVYLTVAPDGVVWVGQDYGGVSRFDGEAWTTYTTADGLAGDFVRFIVVGPDGALWFGTHDGVSRFDGEAWTTYTEDDGLANKMVTSMAVSLDGALWVTTNDGVSRFDGESWKTYTTADGLADNFVGSVAIAPDGALWFDTLGGISRFDGETWTTYTEDDGLASNLVSSISVAPDGTLWFTTAGDGVSRFDGETWTTYTSIDSGLPSDFVRSLAIDDQGRVWMATGDGLCAFDERPSLPAQNLQVWAQAWGVARVLGIAASALLAMAWFVPLVLPRMKRVGWRTPAGVMPAPDPRAPGEIDKDQISPRTRAWLNVVTAACVLVGLGEIVLSTRLLSISRLLGAVSALAGVYTLIATKGFRRWGSKSPIRDKVMAIAAWAGLALIIVTTLSDSDLGEFFTDVTWGTVAVTVCLGALVVIPALARGRRGSWLFLTLGYAGVGAVLTPICFSGWMGSGHLDGSWGGSILGLVGFALSLPGSVVGLVLAACVGSDLVPLTWGGAVAYGAIGLLIGIVLQIIRKATANARDS